MLAMRVGPDWAYQVRVRRLCRPVCGCRVCLRRVFGLRGRVWVCLCQVLGLFKHRRGGSMACSGVSVAALRVCGVCEAWLSVCVRISSIGGVV